MKKKYSLRILSATTYGYTTQIKSTNFEMTNGAYHFYDLIQVEGIQKITNEKYFPIQHTIIEDIEVCE